ncbi:MAG: putative heme-binding domain-containing protein [Planctomycetota bacterium]|jgi:putative heme-binding domain-containing protein
MMDSLRPQAAFALLALLSVPVSAQDRAEAQPLKVFVLAGQSNMQGHAKLRTLAGVAEDPATAPLFARLTNEDGTPRVWDDVWISSTGSGSTEKNGPLSFGFGAEAGGPKIGPEFAFGATIGERLGERVLIIKTAWGGKSLHTDFRPPSAGPYEFSDKELKRFADKGQDVDAERAAKVEATGHYYRSMIGHVQGVLSDIQRVDPSHDSERGYELAGFAWFQGWNDLVASDVYPDRYAPGGYDLYSELLADFIRDVRKDLAAPELPIAIGVLGVGGPTELYGPDKQRYLGVHQGFRDAMAAPASLPEFAGTVTAVLTENYWDHRASELRTKRGSKDAVLTPAELEYLDHNVSNAEYHYLGSAKVLCQIGEALAEALLGLDLPAGSTAGKSAGKSRPRDGDAPQWIWLDELQTHQEVIFRKTIELAAKPAKATLSGSCDDHMIVLINGERVGAHSQWDEVATRDVASQLRKGENLIEVRARNVVGSAGLALRLALDDGQTFVTDVSWKAALAQRAVRGRWTTATALGPVGSETLPWSEKVTLASYDAPEALLTAVDAGGPQAAQPASELHLLDGFEAELLYTVPNEVFGSWVALTTDDKGRLYTSDQGGQGLYRITPAGIPGAGTPGAGASDAGNSTSNVTSIERINVDVSGAQGMCWAFGALYVNVNGQGVWRITDTDQDDQLDRAEHLIKLGNGGEHGPHAIMLTEDGEGLYFIGGNHVRAPEYTSSMAPDNWKEDLLLPRLWDVGGHARGILAPGGWIARCDPNGENITILSNGYRNQYDIALNADGEMFTYDSDMEWDIGSPWYRPTRVCHVTSGSEFGWRGGTGKWPSFYEDATPPMLEIGPGSPTGIVFGTGAKFPARYQDALFILDWTFGTIYALHLEPNGATYSATKEDFVWAKPLGVTDAIVGVDGALYFTVGGRGSQSALYRVRYTGTDLTEPVATKPDAGSARLLRRSLEQFHGSVDPGALRAAWPSLSHDDRFVRFAARIAIENQPVGTWRDRALAEQDTQASIMALIALARQGTAADLPGIVTALGRLPLTGISASQRLGALRAYAIALSRHSEASEIGDELREQILSALDPLFPAASDASDSRVSDATNVELARLLTYLGSPTVVADTLALMRSGDPDRLPEWAELIQRNDAYGGPIAKMLADMPPVRGIAYALILKDATQGWTPELRREYFSFFVEASKHLGGMSYAGFLEKIRDDAAATLTVAEERLLAPLLGQSLFAPLPENITPPEGPGQTWTLAAAVAAAEPALAGRSFERGENLFHAASCSTCHRFDGAGGAIGPDLSTVANKYSVADILESIVEPNKVISDQYGSHIILDRDGNIAEGILVEEGDELTLYSRDPGAEPMVYDRSEIERIKESTTSQMPGGLVDPLSAEELRDLLAYLVSGGNQKDAVFSGAPRDGKKR